MCKIFLKRIMTHQLSSEHQYTVQSVVKAYNVLSSLFKQKRKYFDSKYSKAIKRPRYSNPRNPDVK